MKNNVTRRTFIKGAVGTGVVLAGTNLLTSCSEYDAKGLPTAELGTTGVRIPRIAMGLGSRFCNIDNEDTAIEMLNFAADNGLYYWDTAYIYENKANGAISEERIGKALKLRRDDIFMSTKVTARNPDEAMRQIEGSLKRLQTDKLDMLKIHSIESLDDVNQMSQKGQLIEIVSRLKEQGVTRFIGFSGHGNAEAMKAMAERGDFDSMLIALNHYNQQKNPQERQELVIPAALKKGLGVMLMKAVRPRETVKNVVTTELIRFALSLNGPNGLILGMDSLDVVKSNLNLLRNFTPMDANEKKEMAQALSPFFRHENLEWMDPEYNDGNWA